ncbi:hypothetical protein Igni_1126 [Ignicoccus hospitalis KIN4/I]|uniref:2-keto-4-pentenoate hydratase-like protein n=1 Tax=Ignicoccus hospitalis (strain KIN4/I / DSM 18386 / JCM 14125) TaxID=453591 RepID=A8ABK1_IGNH4|nr:hypothetical protein Igni_1126 [Ignicoccus hospitalis KIN4/I]HIH90777.1 hypothetical protein [Desulfurococcaceae archaeon]
MSDLATGNAALKGCDPFEWKRALEEKNWKCEPENLEEALEVQRKVAEVAKEVWGPVTGWKVGLTGEESKRKFGGGPITGPLFRDGLLGNGSSVELAKLSDPLAEPEIFFCDGSFFLAIEIPDNRYGKRWDELNWLMLLADLAASNKVVVGKEVELRDGEEVRVSGPGVNLVGRIDMKRINANVELLKDKEGCLLLGTVADPFKPTAGEYVMECCGGRATVKFI